MADWQKGQRVVLKRNPYFWNQPYPCLDEVDMIVVGDTATQALQLQAGQVDAFATDDVLLYGLVAQAKAQAQYAVVGDFLSYDPYAIMYRKGDSQLAQLVSDTFHNLAEDREIERRPLDFFRRPPA